MPIRNCITRQPVTTYSASVIRCTDSRFFTVSLHFQARHDLRSRDYTRLRRGSELETIATRIVLWYLFRSKKNTKGWDNDYLLDHEACAPTSKFQIYVSHAQPIQNIKIFSKYKLNLVYSNASTIATLDGM